MTEGLWGYRCLGEGRRWFVKWVCFEAYGDGERGGTAPGLGLGIPVLKGFISVTFLLIDGQFCMDEALCEGNPNSIAARAPVAPDDV